MVEEYKFFPAQDFPLFRKNPILKDRFFSPVPQLVIQKGNFQFLSACKGLAIGNASDDFIKILVVKRFTGRLAYDRASLDFIRLSLIGLVPLEIEAKGEGNPVPFPRQWRPENN